MAEVVICKTVTDLQKYFESKFTDLASKDDINSLKDIIIKQQSIIEENSKKIKDLENKVSNLESSLVVSPRKFELPWFHRR